MARIRQNKPTVDGYRLSPAEADRYRELKALLAVGKIERLEVHPQFPISFEGKRLCTVILSFQYWDAVHRVNIYEEMLGADTALAKLKRKMVEWQYGILTIRTVRRVKQESSLHVEQCL